MPMRAFLTILLLHFAAVAMPDCRLFGGIILNFSPQDQTVDLGGTASVDLVIDNLGLPPYLGDFDITVTYDGGILGAPSVVFGPGLGDPNPAGGETLTGSSSAFGSFEFFDVSLVNPLHLTEIQQASFVLATLKFGTLATGVSPLNMVGITLGDENGDALTATTGTGSITVVAAPEPGTAWLLTMALSILAAGRLRRRVRTCKLLLLMIVSCGLLPAQNVQKVCVSVYRYGGAASTWTPQTIAAHVNLANAVFTQPNGPNVQWIWDNRIIEDLTDPFGQRNGDIQNAPTSDNPTYTPNTITGAAATGSPDIDYIFRATSDSECYPVVFVSGGLGAAGVTYSTPIGTFASRFENPNIKCPVNGSNVACQVGVLTMIDTSSYPKAEDPATKQKESQISTLAHEFGHAVCLDPESNPMPADPATPRWGDSTHHPPNPNSNPPGNVDATMPDTPEGAGLVVPAGFKDAKKQLRFDVMWFTGTERSGDETFTARQSTLASTCGGLMRGRFAPSFSVAPNSPSMLSPSLLYYAPAPPNGFTPGVTVTGDDITGISYDRRQFIQGRYAFRFTVDATSMGINAATPVAGFPDRSASEFAGPVVFPVPGHVAVMGSPQFGLFGNDQIDALEPLPPSVPDPARTGAVTPLPTTSSRIYFTVGAGAAGLRNSATIYAGDASTDANGMTTRILSIYALPNQMGLSMNDTIGSMCVADNGNGTFDSKDSVYFTLKKGSPTLIGTGLSAADILKAAIPTFGNPPPQPPAQMGGFFVAQGHASLGLLAADQIMALKCYQPPRTCDVNLDGKVDINDISAITAQRNTVASPGDPLDVNADGVINVNDARICSQQCDKPGCAP